MIKKVICAHRIRLPDLAADRVPPNSVNGLPRSQMLGFPLGNPTDTHTFSCEFVPAMMMMFITITTMMMSINYYNC